MNKNLFQIDPVLKLEVKELKKIEFIEVDNITLAVLNSYRSLLEKQNRSIEKLKNYIEEKLGDLGEKEIYKKKTLSKLNILEDIDRENDNIIGENPKIKQIKKLVSNIAKTDATVLIIGETGCGKEVFANEIYNESNRIKFPYVKINCAAIPETLIESELFGYERGAFTGANNKGKLGVFEMANGGTILLDEIEEMPMNLQSKLLRVIQEKEIIRLSGTKSIKLDVRIIAATNKDLTQLIKEGRFRPDLYYRLNVVQITIPPLRKRKDDINILACNLLKKFNTKYNKLKKIDNTSINLLKYYDWPGNVRELENVIERLVIYNDNEFIFPKDIVDVMENDNNIINSVNKDRTLREAINSLEKGMIENALKIYGSTYKAARILGVSQPTIFRKAKALKIKSRNIK